MKKVKICLCYLNESKSFLQANFVYDFSHVYPNNVWTMFRIISENPSNEALTQHLMYGNKDFPHEINRNILELTLHFINDTGRFD